jgi:hypothetical protein
VRLVWTEGSLGELEVAAAWSLQEAARVVVAMERMSETGFDLGRPTDDGGYRYWPVPPLGVVYWSNGEELTIISVVDVRRLP